MATEKTGTLTAVDGVYSNIADPLRPPTSLKVGNNINQYPAGVFTNQISGWSKQSQTAFNSGAEFFGFSSFVDTDGTRFLLFQVGDTLYEYAIDTDTETSIMTALDLTTDSGKKAIPCMRMFVPYAASNPYMVYVNGKSKPQKITYAAGFTAADLQLNAADFGTTALSAALAGKTPSDPRFCEPFLDRMIYAGFTGAAAFDILITNAGDAEVCTQASPATETDGGLMQVDPQLGLVTAVKAFKLSNATNEQIVLIGQEHGVSIITGTGGSTFKCYTLTDEYGIPSNSGFVQINSNLWFLASDGVRQFSALAENANLIGSALTFPVQDMAYRLNETYLYKAHAVHHKRYQEVQFWFPVDSDTDPSTAFVMSYAGSRDPQQLSVAIFTKDGTECLASIYFDKVFYGGNGDGILQRHHDGNLYDTEPVVSQMDFAMMVPDDPETECSLEKFTVVTYGGGQKFLINTNYLARVADGDTIGTERFDAEPTDHILSSTVTSGTVLDTWSLGNSAIPSEHMRYHDFYPIAAGALSFEASLKCNESDHKLDFMLANYRLGVGNRNA